MASELNLLIALDSTQKTNQYNYNLFTMVAQNKYGNGVPVVSS